MTDEEEYVIERIDSKTCGVYLYDRESNSTIEMVEVMNTTRAYEKYNIVKDIVDLEDSDVLDYDEDTD